MNYLNYLHEVVWGGGGGGEIYVGRRGVICVKLIICLKLFWLGGGGEG